MSNCFTTTPQILTPQTRHLPRGTRALLLGLTQPEPLQQFRKGKGRHFIGLVNNPVGKPVDGDTLMDTDATVVYHFRAPFFVI